MANRKKTSTTLVLINRNSGTVRTRGADAVQTLVQTSLQSHFPELEIELFSGDIAEPLQRALARYPLKTVIAGGGDGTISSAAMALIKKEVTLGVLPLGTMNLFSRALGFSPGLEQALDEMARTDEQTIDVGVINERLFLRQVSFGLQPRLVRLRERIGYRSRVTKMLSGVKAFTVLAADPRKVRIDLELDGTLQSLKVPLVIVSNNRLGQEINFSVQASLTDGELGLYALKDFSPWTLIGLARDHLANRLIVNPALDMTTAHSIVIHPRKSRLTGQRPKTILASIDGELANLPYPLKISVRPKSLSVLSLKPS
jgi:diacylglycerol kinase family enzyme